MSRAPSITLSNGPLPITQDLDIEGPGANNLTISGNDATQVFNVSNAVTATIAGLTIADGYSASDGGGIQNGDGTLTVTNCTLSGNAALDGGGIYNDGALTITNSTLSGNSAPANGGGIENDGTLNVTNSTLSGNSAPGGFGGGIYNDGTLSVTSSTLSGNSASADGGGIEIVSGTATITNSTLSRNSTTNDDGGGIENWSGTVSVTNSTLSGNFSFFDGSGIENDYGTLTVTNSTLSGNAAHEYAGIYNYQGTATLANTIIAGNTAPSAPDVYGTFDSLGCNLIGNSSGGGGFATSDLVNVNPLLGPLQNNGGPTETMALLPGSPAIDAGSSPLVPSGITTDQRGFPRDVNGVDIGAFEVQVYLVYSTADSGGGSLRTALTNANRDEDSVIAFTTSGVIDLASPLPAINRDVQILGPGANNLTVSGNDASQVFYVSGGVTATIAGLTIADGYSSSDGGGVENYGALTITNSTLSGNSAPNGGGVYNYGTLTITDSTLSGNVARHVGGGIDNESALIVANSTFSGNSAPYGGGIDNDVMLTVTNSTFSGNHAIYGGGIDNTGKLTVTNSTLAGNSAGEGGGIAADFGTMANTIIAGNTAPTGPDVVGAVNSKGYNLIGNNSGGSGFVATDLQGTALNPLNPLLGPLQNNGGPTETMALLPGSLAIGDGSVALAVDANGKPFTTDQRGSPRIFNGTVDIGAFESRGFTITVTSGNNQQTVVGTAFAAPLVVTVSSPYGEPVAGGSVTFAVPASGASATFTGSSPTINASGQASITVAANTTAGSYTVSAYVTGVFIAHFDLTNTPGAPTKLVIQTQPSATATAGKAFATQPVIYVEDQYGNLETGDNSTRVRVGLKTGTGPLLGTTTVTVAGGIAAFSGLADKTAGRIVLVFGSGTLARAASNKITISRDPGKAMAIGASTKVVRVPAKLKASLAAYLSGLWHAGPDVN